MTATHEQNSTIPTTPVLNFSLELKSKNWKLAFTIGLGQKPRLRTIAARNTDGLLAVEAKVSGTDFVQTGAKSCLFPGSRHLFCPAPFLPRG